MLDNFIVHKILSKVNFTFCNDDGMECDISADECFFVCATDLSMITKEMISLHIGEHLFKRTGKHFNFLGCCEKTASCVNPKHKVILQTVEDFAFHVLGKEVFYDQINGKTYSHPREFPLEHCVQVFSHDDLAYSIGSYFMERINGAKSKRIFSTCNNGLCINPWHYEEIMNNNLAQNSTNSGPFSCSHGRLTRSSICLGSP